MIFAMSNQVLSASDAVFLVPPGDSISQSSGSALRVLA